MAKRSVPRGDTSPGLRLRISDQSDLVDISTALGTVTGYFQGSDPDTGAFIGTITGPVTALVPPQAGLDENGKPTEFNAIYEWQAGDTDTVANYKGQVRVLWDLAGTETETFPCGKDGKPVYFEFAVVETVIP